MGGGNGNQMPGKGTFGARVICAESRVGKFPEIGFTCTQPDGSGCAALELTLWAGGGREARAGLPCERGGPGEFLEGFYTSRAPPPHLPPSGSLSFPAPSSPPHPPSVGSSDFAFEKAASDTLDEHLADSWVA